MARSVSRKSSKGPVVMVHGAFCGGWAFDNFRAAFEAEGYEVYCPTLRHHDKPGLAGGLSTIATVSLLDYVQDLTAFIARLDDPPILVGHSMGGLLCQILAARGHVLAVMLLAPSPPWGVLPSTLNEVAVAQGLFMAGPFWSMPMVPGYSYAADHALDRLPEAERRQVFARLVPESGLAMFEIMHWAADPKAASRAHARDVRCPVLCVTGTEDRINPPGTVRRIARRYRGGYVALEGFSHWLIGEPGWEEVARLGTDWLDAELGL